MAIRFDGRVAIVTGAGNGLGRAHALGLASRGAKVVVNDFGGARDGTGGSLTAAETVVEEIRKAGGTAMADGADVSNFEQVTAMVERATKEWGSVDIMCANAGILRDKSFGKMEVADFAKVLDVHLVGTFYCCKAVWNGMRERNYGRIVMTTSSSGLFGNFGQANYGAAKSGMVGLMNVLAEEGRKTNIRVNIISPTAATRMTEELLPPGTTVTAHGHRHVDPNRREMKTERLRIGDVLLLVGFWTDIRRLQSHRADLVVLNLPAELDEVLPAGTRAPQALLSLAVVIGLMVSGIVPNVQAALIGCLLMGALGCIDFASAYRSIHWSSLVLIAGMLPFSLALQRTGGVDLAANALIQVIGGAGPGVVLASLFAITAILGLFISNTATAVLMGPVALAIAQELHASPYPFAMIVALAASAAFMTPVSSPVNTLVVAPGNYGFADFVKIGVPFTLVVLLVSVMLVPVLLPL